LETKLQIILHCLPREIDEVERICNHLQRSSHLLDGDDKVVLDFTLNVSNTLTDWDKSKLPKEFFIEKWKMIEKRSDWTDKNIFEINTDGTCLGCNDKRRNSIRKYSDDVTHFMYLDTDVHFSVYNLFYVFRALESIKNEYHILSSQLLRLWDEGWDIISNDRFIPMGYDSKIWLKFDPFGIDKECYNHLEDVKIKELPYVKFGGGWFNIFSSNLLKFIDIPDSLSSYGLDDTFVVDCANLMKQNGHDVSQYIIDNMVVCENRKYRDLNPYNNLIEDLTVDESFKQKYRDNAQLHYPNEIEKFKNRL
tara:strand:+ start:85 stop:1005 length:921 start_codon:yes stop_codon:yes gene_type:complete